MSFKNYIQKEIGHHKHKVMEHENAIENQLKASNILRSYPFETTERFISKLKSLVPFSIKGRKKAEVIEIGNGTYLVKEPNFDNAFSSVSKILDVQKPDSVKWVRVFQNKFSGAAIEKETVGFKFFIDENSQLEEENLEPVLEQDHIPVDVNDYVIGAVKDGYPSIKLISVLNDDEMITKHLIYHVAEKLDVHDVSASTMKKIFQDMNMWVSLVAEQVSENSEGKKLNLHYLVRIVDNNTKAFLRIKLLNDSSPIPDVDDVVEVLKNRGIVFGIDKAEIEKYLRQGNFRSEIVAAQGVMPQEGKEGYVEEVAVERAKKQNKGDKKSTSQFFTPFVTVKRGDTVLFVVHGTPGISGKDVFGREVSAHNGESAFEELKLGDNLYYAKDNCSVLSRIGGNLIKSREGVWNVEKVLELDEVGPQSGNITHLGSVLVAGSVLDGFSLVATGNIRVMKSVGGSNIEAGGDVDIFLGMNGKNKGKVTSHFGSVNAKFFVDTEIAADRNVKVEELLANCKVDCGNIVQASGTRSAIWGGNVNAYRAIYSNNIGSVAERKTEVGVGLSQALRLKIKQNSEVQQLKKDEIKRINTLLSGGEARSAMSLLGTKEKDKYEKQIVKLRNEILELEYKRKDLLKEKELSSTDCHITVKQTLYGNVTLFCNKGRLVNKRYRKAVILTQNRSSLSAQDHLKVDAYIQLKDKKKVFVN